MPDTKNFINPYNFIPVGKLKGAAQKDEQKRTYTGVIQYSVRTKSPLFIPNTSNDKTFQPSYDFVPQKEDQEHKSYDFYSYHDLGDYRDDKSVPQTWERQFFRPVIPGSEIRGMFRCNYEILTNSCISALDTDTKLSKRTMERFSAGLFKKNGNFLELHKAKDALWRTKGANSTADEEDWQETNPAFYTRKCYQQQKYPEGCHVSFTEEEREANGRKIKALAKKVRIYNNSKIQLRSRKDGYILKGEDGPEIKPEENKVIPQKHCCHIIYDPGKTISDSIPCEGNKLDLVLWEYEKNGIHMYAEYKEQWEQFKTGKNEEYFPVYYSLIEDGGKELLFLSPACITREVYEHTLMDLAGNLKPCEDKNTLCPACSLFGTVMKESAVSSRIRFSDLEGEEREDYSQCYESPITLPPLSSPQLNNMEFYVRRPKGALFWTYDYYIGEDGKVQLQKGELAGRKFYWHNAQKLDSLSKEWEYDGTANQLNMTVRPVKDGYLFKGKLYFKKLTQKELDLLIYLINAGDEDDLETKKHGYKLGAAKPLGFGSIACHADCVRLISYQRKGNTIQRTERKYVSQMQSDLVEQKIEKNFAKMTDFAAASEKGVIRYPKLEEDEGNSWNESSQKEDDNEGFQWFAANHATYDRRKSMIDNKMPSNRISMVYVEYMEPMEPGLRKTAAGSLYPAKSKNKDIKPHKQHMKNKKMR